MQMETLSPLERVSKLLAQGYIHLYQIKAHGPDGICYMLKLMTPGGEAIMLEMDDAYPELKHAACSPAQAELTSRTLGRIEAAGHQLRGHVVHEDQQCTFYLNSRSELKVHVFAVEFDNGPAVGRFEVYPLVDMLDLEICDHDDEDFEAMLDEVRAITQSSVHLSLSDELVDLHQCLNHCALLLEDYSDLLNQRTAETNLALESEKDYLTICQLRRHPDDCNRFSREVVESGRGLRELHAKLTSMVELLQTERRSA